MSRVAVIMRSKNEMPHLPAAIRSLRGQTFQDYELWAVDSGSTDGSVEILKNELDAARLIRIASSEYVPGKVLNGMTARTTQEFVVFQNADAIFKSDDALEKLLQPLFDGEADATMSSQVTRPDAKFIVTYDYLRAYNPKKIPARRDLCAELRPVRQPVFPNLGTFERVGARFSVCGAQRAVRYDSLQHRLPRGDSRGALRIIPEEYLKEVFTALPEMTNQTAKE
jgi:glycosyltransferase involved in cell wall biosynthesis